MSSDDHIFECRT